MIRIVVTGSECTGKTTLARALAKHYETVWVPEYARQFVAKTGTVPKFRDVESIARGQLELEDSLAAEANQLLVLDTDLLSTIVYSRHYFGDCPQFIEVALHERAGDLYLLADIDLPWVAEGQQRDRGDRREEMQELFRQALRDRGLSFVDIRGSCARRLELAIAAIDPLFPDAAGP